MSKTNGYSKNTSNQNANSASVNSLPIASVIDSSGGSLSVSFGAVQSSVNGIITELSGDESTIASLPTLEGTQTWTGSNTYSNIAKYGSDISNNYTSNTLVAKSYVDNQLLTQNNVISGSTLYSGTNTFSASNTFSGNNNSFTGTGNTFSNAVNYASDISNNFTNESLVSKRYCDAAPSTLLSASNTWTNSNQFNSSILVSNTGSLTVSGAGNINRSNGAFFQCLAEAFTSATTVSSNRYRLSWGGGTSSSVFVLGTAPTGTITLDLWNCSASSSQSCVYTLIYLNTNKVYPNVLNLYTDAGSTLLPGGWQTIWLGGAPSGISSAVVSVFSVSIMAGAVGASNYALASLSTYY